MPQITHYNAELHLHTQLMKPKAVISLTWLRVGVVHGVTIQLKKLHRLRLLLSIAAHGKGVLTHLYEVKRQEVWLRGEIIVAF